MLWLYQRHYAWMQECLITTADPISYLPWWIRKRKYKQMLFINLFSDMTWCFHGNSIYFSQGIITVISVLCISPHLMTDNINSLNKSQSSVPIGTDHISLILFVCVYILLSRVWSISVSCYYCNSQHATNEWIIHLSRNQDCGDIQAVTFMDLDLNSHCNIALLDL